MSLGRGHRQRQQLTGLQDYVLHTIQQLSHSTSPSVNSPTHLQSSCSPYPITQYVNCDKFYLSHRAFLAAVTRGVEPTSFAKAVKDAK